MKCPVNFTLELQNKAREPGCCHVWPDGSSVAFCLKFYWFWLSRKKFGHLKQVKWDVCMFTVVLLIRYVFYNVTNFQQLWTNKVEVFVWFKENFYLILLFYFISSHIFKHVKEEIKIICVAWRYVIHFNLISKIIWFGLNSLFYPRLQGLAS